MLALVRFVAQLLDGRRKLDDPVLALAHETLRTLACCFSFANRAIARRQVLLGAVQIGLGRGAGVVCVGQCALEARHLVAQRFDFGQRLESGLRRAARLRAQVVEFEP